MNWMTGFHAVEEALAAGRPLDRIVIARGRDASDVAISNSFGMTTLAGFKVWTEPVTSNQ